MEKIILKLIDLLRWYNSDKNNSGNEACTIMEEQTANLLVFIKASQKIPVELTVLLDEIEEACCKAESENNFKMEYVCAHWRAFIRNHYDYYEGLHWDWIDRDSTKDDTSSNNSTNTAKNKPRKTKTIKDYILLDDIEQKQKFLDKLHTLIDDNIGKYVAFVIRTCVKHGLMRKPKFPILKQTFGDIGNVSGYSKYYKLPLTEENDKNEIKGIETHILPFLDSI